MAIIELAPNALIDKDYFLTLFGECEYEFPEESVEEARLYSSINFVSSMFESFCNRNLLARDYTYDSEDENGAYNPKYTIFSGNGKNTLWLPTYPINSVTTLIIEDVPIPQATNYNDTNGFFIDPAVGKILYEGCFPCGYRDNIKIAWNGGYEEDTVELESLKFLCFEMVKTVLTNIQNNNEYYRREQIGTYSYERFIPSELDKYKGMNPMVFNMLSTKFKKVVLP